MALVTLSLDSERERALVTPERIANATVDVSVHRLEGMRQVFPDAPAISASGSLIDEGVLVGRMLLTDPATRPTAVLAQSDLLAVGVIRAAEELGLRVPEDLSVAGFDGIPLDGFGDLTLTTSVQPAVEKGRAAGSRSPACSAENRARRSISPVCSAPARPLAPFRTERRPLSCAADRAAGRSPRNRGCGSARSRSPRQG